MGCPLSMRVGVGSRKHPHQTPITSVAMSQGLRPSPCLCVCTLGRCWLRPASLPCPLGLMVSVPQMVSACPMPDPRDCFSELCQPLRGIGSDCSVLDSPSLGWGEAASMDFSCALLVALLLRESFPPPAAFRWFPRVSVSSGCITSTTDGVGVGG